ncbi:MAG: SRPBCC domain-containing protein [Comamonas sp.]
MTQRLYFAVSIAAPRPKVWETMLSPDGYRDWTSVFCEGSTYEGSWEQGAKIRFLAPNGDGMTSEIAERREGQLLSIRHLGEVRNGVDDTQSPQVQAWAPAYENFHLRDLPAGGTELRVELDTVADYAQYMHDTYPRALQRLKALCEA